MLISDKLPSWLYPAHQNGLTFNKPLSLLNPHHPKRPNPSLFKSAPQLSKGPPTRQPLRIQQSNSLLLRYAASNANPTSNTPALPPAYLPSHSTTLIRSSHQPNTSVSAITSDHFPCLPRLPKQSQKQLQRMALTLRLNLQHTSHLPRSSKKTNRTHLTPNNKTSTRSRRPTMHLRPQLSE